MYHAAVSVLDRVKRVQRRLLRELCLTELDALLRHRLAPLPSQRDIAMLPVLHKVVLSLAPPQLAAFFPFQGVISEPSGGQRVRGWAPLHCMQLGTPYTITSTDTMQRSLFL